MTGESWLEAVVAVAVAALGVAVVVVEGPEAVGKAVGVGWDGDRRGSG